MEGTRGKETEQNRTARIRTTAYIEKKQKTSTMLAYLHALYQVHICTYVCVCYRMAFRMSMPPFPPFLLSIPPRFLMSAMQRRSFFPL